MLLVDDYNGLITFGFGVNRGNSWTHDICAVNDKFNCPCVDGYFWKKWITEEEFYGGDVDIIV